MDLSSNSQIKGHYHRDALYEAIIEKLQSVDIPLDQVSRSDLSKVDEFHVRGAEVSKELANKIDLKHSKVLDVGCGIGGPCRMLADEYNCDVTGIDLSDEFIRTARKLTELVRLDDRTTFLQGDATSLPFEDASFDAVWTQHVQMNIANKKQFYSEIARVLKPEGKFIYYDIFKKDDGAIGYPMPWADKEAISHLFTLSEKHQILDEVDLTVTHRKDETAAGISFFENLLDKIDHGKDPVLGLNVLMGSTTRVKLGNLLEALKDGKLELESGICSKK